MKNFSLKKGAAFFFCTVLFLCGCQISPSPEYKNPLSSAPSLPNPMLPPTPLDSTEGIEESPTPSEFWDTSDIDTDYIQFDRKLIAFTFDDAPSRLSEDLLAVFAAYNEENPDCKASATIFYNGGLFDNETKHLLYAACALGIELGNHSHSHYDLTTLSQEVLQSEIQQTDDILKEADGKPYHLFRAPFGRTNELVKQCVNTPILDWTIDTLDWKGKTEEEIYQAIFTNRFDGAIALMHDGYKNTISAVKRLLPDLKANGYQVVSVSALAKMHNCTMKKGNVYIRLRKK